MPQKIQFVFIGFVEGNIFLGLGGIFSVQWLYNYTCICQFINGQDVMTFVSYFCDPYFCFLEQRDGDYLNFSLF